MKKIAPLTRKKIFVLLTAILAVTSISSFFILREEEMQDKRRFRGVTVEVESVRTGSIARRVNVVGTLMANQQVTVRPQVHGLVADIMVQGGQEVGQDTPILKIDDRLYKAQVQETEAKFALSKAEHARISSLVAKKFGSQKKLDEAKANLDITAAQLESARQHLADTVIRAPFDGVISINNISVGTPVSEQTELFSVTDLDPILLDFKVPGEYIRGLSVGQQLIVDVDGFLREKFAATIALIDSRVDPTTHSILVRAVLNNKKRLLRPGLFARVELVVGSVDDALLIPRSAIETSGDTSYVYKVVNGVANRIPVQVGFEEKNIAQIAYGLAAGDKIITIGTSKVKDGYPVIYTENTESVDVDPGNSAASQTPSDKGTSPDQQAVVEPAPSLSEVAETVGAR